MDGANKFHFNWKDLVPSGLSVKDAIAPTALAFKNSRTFQMGGIFGAVSFLNITASDLSDQLLKDFLDMDSSQIVTMHIQSVDQNKAIKTIKHTITELDRSKIEEQKKAVRAGYDMDVLPSDLATYGRDAKALLKELQSQNERIYDAKYVKWSIADLPILPQKWQYLVSASTKKQFGILQKLMNRPDVDSIVNSCDAGQCGWVT